MYLDTLNDIKTMTHYPLNKVSGTTEKNILGQVIYPREHDKDNHFQNLKQPNRLSLSEDV